MLRKNKMKTENNKQNTSSVAIERSVKNRTISEEYNACSPNTKEMVNAHTEGETPTSKRKATYTNITKYNESNEYEKSMMILYGLVPPTAINILCKVPDAPNNKNK